MKNITDTIQGGRKTYSFLLAAIIALCAVCAANAAEIAEADLQAAGLWSEFDNLAGDPSRASSSITNSPYVAAKAFDGNYDNVEPNRFMVNSLPVSLYYRFDSPKCVNAIRISNQCWVSGQSRSPKAFVFEGSNDGETWTTIGSESGLSTWANTSDSKYGTNGTMTRRVFKYANADSYVYYRITFTETMSEGAALAVSEIDFYHMEPYYWRGPAAEDANLSNPNNWSHADGRTATVEPGAGCSMVFTNDATLTVDKPLSVQSISANGYAVLFDNPAPDDSGAVATNTLTVSGSITGGTDKFAVFRCKVQCTDRFKKASRSQFPGGLTARYMHEHCNAWGTNTKMLEGEFFFTEPWPLAGSASVPWTLGSADLPDSVLHAPTLTSTDASMLTVLQRSKAYFSGDMQMGRPDENHPSGAATLPILRIERGYARIAGTLSSITGYLGSGPSVHGTNHVRRLLFTTNGSADDKYRIDTVCFYPKFVIDEAVENAKRRYSVVFVNMHNRLDFWANGDFTFDRKGGNKAVVSSRSSGANFILGWHTTWEGASHNITVNQDFGPSNHEGYLPTFGMEIDGEGGSVTLNEPISLNSGTVISGGVKAVAGAAGVFGTSAVSAGTGTTLCISNGVALANAVNIASGATLEYLDGASISGAVTLADGSAIALRFTTDAAAPCISFASAPTVNGKVTVKVSAADGVNARNVDGKWLIATNVSGGTFEIDDEDKPLWAESVAVEGGNLYLNVKTRGLSLSVR